MNPNADLPPDKFVTLDGARYQYLDWGGTGDALLLLPGLGCSVHVFCKLAPQFTSHFHVVGFNRRGHGQSDMPVNPPTIPSLADDTVKFIDAMALGRTHLVGHSLGGMEVSEIASRHPDLVARLVYLDGAIDWRDHKSAPPDPLSPTLPDTSGVFPSYDAYVEFVLAGYPTFRHLWGDAMDAMFRAGLVYHDDGSVEERFKDKDAEPLYKAAREYVHPFDLIEAPALALCAVSDTYDGIPDGADPLLREQTQVYWEEVIMPLRQAAIRRFLQGVKHPRAVQLQGASHYVFVDHLGEVVQAMRDFLLP